MLPTKFGVNWPFSSEADQKNRFSRWRPEFSYFDLLVTPKCPIKFQDNWPFLSGEDGEQIFKMAAKLAILDPFIGTILAFLSTSHPYAFYQVFNQLDFPFRRRSKKVDFQEGGHLGFQIGMILAFFFYVQVTLMLPTKFGVNWPFSSEVDQKNRFSRWRPEFSYFDLLVTPKCPIKFQDNWPFLSGEDGEQIFKMAAKLAILDPFIGTILAFLSTSHPYAFYQVFNQLDFPFRGRSKKVDFQEGGHLGFQIGKILAIFSPTRHPDASDQI